MEYDKEHLIEIIYQGYLFRLWIDMSFDQPFEVGDYIIGMIEMFFRDKDFSSDRWTQYNQAGFCDYIAGQLVEDSTLWIYKLNAIQVMFNTYLFKGETPYSTGVVHYPVSFSSTEETRNTEERFKKIEEKFDKVYGTIYRRTFSGIAYK